MKILYFGWPVLVVGLAFLLYQQSGGSTNSAGKRLYTTHCANCHMENGQGLRQLIPPLAEADYVLNHGADLACMIRYGIQDSMLVNRVWYSGVMPANEYLDDVELVSVINYIKQSWGNSGESVTYPEVKKALSSCP